jgi:pantothenate kinase
LANRIRRLADRHSRVLIGIAGAPGAGKSTLAAAVVSEYGPGAVLVGMDGFHLAQRVLDEAGTAPVKGAPETFDAAGYVALLERLVRVSDEVVYAPEFRRELEEPIAGAVAVPPDARVVVTEGNYLLLDEAPWDRVRALCTEVWFLDVPDTERVDRLVRRHVRFGRLPEEARDRAETGTDGRNAALVLASRGRADLLLLTPTRGGSEPLESAHRTG